MNILALEASGAQAAIVALQISETSLEVRAVWRCDDVRSLSRELVIQVAQTLENARWNRSEMDAIAVGIGPGSWTSLRVLLSTCKTLSQTLGCALCGVPTFDAVARAAWNDFAQSSTRTVPQNAIVVVATPSRANEIYSKIRRVENQIWTTIRAEQVGTIEDLRDEIANEKFVLFAGEAAPALSSLLQSELKSTNENDFSRELSLEIANVSVEETAREIGRLAFARLQVGASDDALVLQPLYVALSAAERNLAERNLAQRELAQRELAQRELAQRELARKTPKQSSTR